MVACVRKRKAEEAGKVEVAPGVTVASFRRFRAALIALRLLIELATCGGIDFDIDMLLHREMLRRSRCIQIFL